MSHLDRLREGRYIAPSGKDFSFDFSGLTRSGGKKNAIHELPQQDKAVVQDVGQTIQAMPIKAYFHGPDYDKTADAFFDALGERGPGTLLHPRWGDVSALAVSFAQSEEFVDGLGQAIFDIDFVRVDKASGLVSTERTAAAIGSAAAAARVAAAAVYAKKFKVPYLDDLLKCKDLVRSTVKSLRASLLKIIGQASELGQKFNAEIVSIENDIDALLQTPADLGAAISSVIAAPVQGLVRAKEKIDAYAAALDALGKVKAETPAQAEIQTLAAVSIYASAAESSSLGSIRSRSEAVAMRDRLALLFKSTRQVIEGAESSSGSTADPEAMASLATLSGNATAYLLESSFNLQVERRVTLEGEATPLDLVYRFYGKVDDATLEEFCDQNHLQGDDLFLVPAGTEVRYYAS